MAGKGKYYESQFEEATIELLRESHWQYTFGDDIHRRYTDPLIEDDLRAFLAAQYKNKELTASEMDGILATRAARTIIMPCKTLSCSIVTDTILSTATDGTIRFACNTSTSSIPTIIYSVASTNLSWNKAARTVGPTSCFS